MNLFSITSSYIFLLQNIFILESLPSLKTIPLLNLTIAWFAFHSNQLCWKIRWSLFFSPLPCHPTPATSFCPPVPTPTKASGSGWLSPPFPFALHLVSWVPLSFPDCLFYASITVLPPLLLTFGIAAHPIPRLSSLSLWCCILHGSREPWVQALDSRKGTQGWGAPSRVRKMPWRRKWQPTAVFLPGESHGQRSLAGN